MVSRAPMTTSATGHCNKRRTPAPVPAGFTLLEVLVVVLIVGIVLTFMTLSLGGDRRGEELERDAQQFTELLRLASEQTVLRGEEWGVAIERSEYRFLVYGDEGWVEQSEDNLFRPRTLTPGTEFAVELEGREIVLGGARADTDTSNANKAKTLKPTLFILSSGEFSPFLARFSAPQTQRRIEVRADALGTLSMETLEP